MLKRISTIGWAVAMVALLLVMFSAAGTTTRVSANPITLSVGDGTAAVGSTQDITFQVHDDSAGTPAGGAVGLGASPAGIGYFVSGLITHDFDECDPSGVGTNALTWDQACMNGLDGDTDADAASGTATWVCLNVGAVQLTLTQNSVTLNGGSTVINCTAAVSTPVRLTLQSDPEEEVTTCPSTVRITARVIDINGSPLPDGIIVTFTANGGRLTAGFGTTINGFAETTLEVSGPLPPEITVLATATVNSVPLANTITLEINCGSFNAPDQITWVLSSPTAECGKTIFVGGKVLDDDGRTVTDGTPVELLTSAGTLDPTSTTTLGGVFTVKFTAPATAGTATITASVKGLFSTTTIEITCPGASPTPAPGAGTATGPTTAGGATGAAGGAGAAGAPGTGTGAAGAIQPPSTGGNGSIRPPSTGDAGLRTESGGPISLVVIACLVGGALAAATLRRAA